jgi:hypothetical protein
MPKEAKVAFLEQLEKRFGKIEKLPNSLSLYDVGKGAGQIFLTQSIGCLVSLRRHHSAAQAG